MSQPKLEVAETAIRAAIRQGTTPGAVLVVGRQGKIVLRGAYGQRAKLPVSEPNLMDTLYDMASLTKPLATAVSALALVEEGKLSLRDRLIDLLPETIGTGKDSVTVEQLLRHRAGLPADNDESEYVGTPEEMWGRIFRVRPRSTPGSRFLYSDLGFLLLGKIVERVSGQTLDRYATDRIYSPLRMTDTGFRPAGEPCPRCAPTSLRQGAWMRGSVHDPRSYALGGVAGHAGLFSTADDLAAYAQMILNCGQFEGVEVLKRETVREMTAMPADPADQRRGLGWDIDTPFSTTKGDVFPLGSFGHTGYTGSSVWIDPSSETFVILLANRVHPTDQGASAIVRLRRDVATAVGGSITAAPRPSRAGVRNFCAPERSGPRLLGVPVAVPVAPRDSIPTPIPTPPLNR